MIKSDKDAIGEMTEWLSHPLEFGEEPEEIKVYFRKKLHWFRDEVKCFLMWYKMPSGFEFIGITGPVTWSFMGIPMEEIHQMRKTTHKKELINIYFGWHLAFLQNQADSKSTKHDEKKLAEIIRNLTTRTKNIPVNLSIHSCLHLGNSEFYVLKGDMLCENVDTGMDLQNIKICDRNKEDPEPGEYRGVNDVYYFIEDNDLFKCKIMNSREPLIGKVPLYYFLGNKLGPYGIYHPRIPSLTSCCIPACLP